MTFSSPTHHHPIIKKKTGCSSKVAGLSHSDSQNDHRSTEWLYRRGGRDWTKQSKQFINLISSSQGSSSIYLRWPSWEVLCWNKKANVTFTWIPVPKTRLLQNHSSTGCWLCKEVPSTND